MKVGSIIYREGQGEVRFGVSFDDLHFVEKYDILQDCVFDLEQRMNEERKGYFAKRQPQGPPTPFPDERDKKLLSLVYAHGQLECEDERVTAFEHDRGDMDDTIIRCVNAGNIKQVGDSFREFYVIVPWWWPYRDPEHAKAVQGWDQSTFVNGECI